MQLSQIWSHACVEHFLIYIRPLVFSGWLKQWSCKTSLSKHLHLLFPCNFIGISESGSKAGGNPGLELRFVNPPSQSLQHPALGDTPFCSSSLTFGRPPQREGWAGLSPPIPLAPHKAHANNYSCLIVSKRIVHKPRGSSFPQFVLKALQSQGWCRNQEPVKQWNKDQRASLQPATSLMHTPCAGKTGSSIAKHKGGDLGMWNLERHNCSWRVMKGEQSTKSQAHNSPHWLPW